MVLLQVIEPTTRVLVSEGGVPYNEPEINEARKTSTMAYLDGREKSLRERGLRTLSTVGLGSPADQIIDYAEVNSIDMIAMSTHGRSGIGRWVFGSVTDKVLHAGDTPVMVIRAVKA